MGRKQRILVLCLSALLAAALIAEEPSAPAPVQAPGLSTAQVSALEDRMRRMQELMNQMELQAEQTESALDKAKPQPISFGQGQLLLQEALYGPALESASGAQVLLGFNLDPDAEVHGSVDLEILGAVAADRTLPQQELAQFYTKNQRVLLKKSEIRFENDLLLARAYRMVPRADPW